MRFRLFALEEIKHRDARDARCLNWPWDTILEGDYVEPFRLFAIVTIDGKKQSVPTDILQPWYH